MIKNFNLVLKSVKKRGFIETIVQIIKHVLTKLCSLIKIFILNVRGYRISQSVVLRGNNHFFQSTKQAIKILNNTTLGKGTRVTCGESGKIFIGENSLVDDNTFIMAHESISIGKNTKIAAFCFITDFNHKFENKSLPIDKQGYETSPVSIGDDVWIGTHSVVLPGVVIGDRVVIGAGSIVTKNIPSNTIAVGNPAKVIKHI